MSIGSPTYLLDLTEKQYQDLIIEAALANNYMVYHTHDSRRSQPGFPDLVLAKPGRSVLYIEVKTERGRVSLAQHQWIDTLRSAAGEQRVMIARPSDWDIIAGLLSE